MRGLLCLLAAASPARAADVDVHGFAQVNYAARTTGRKPSPAAGDFLLGDERVQISLAGFAPSGAAGFLAKADFFHDAVDGRADMDLREAYLDLPGEYLEARLGRQIVTWGVGDLLFISDVFPKDWEAFFSGRPLEYLKSGSDALKLNFYYGALGVEAIAVPFFTPDRLPDAQRFFLHDPFAGVGQKSVSEPSKDLENTELALRAYRPLGAYDAALYVYRGFHRTPAAFPDSLASPAVVSLRYPRLNVYGVSAQGPAPGGVAVFEAGYYDSREDLAGTDSLIPNSQARYLLGYRRQLGKDLSGGLQYYGEYMLRHGRYRGTIPAGFPAADRLRQVLTLRLTRTFKYQTWRVSLFSYWSPTDEDFYLIPEVRHSLADGIWLALGANIFGGASRTTFFGQFDRNDNVYMSARYEF